MVVHVGDVELIEHQSAGFQALIVTGDAVLVEQGALGGGRTGQRDRGGRGRNWPMLLRAGGLEIARQGGDRQYNANSTGKRRVLFLPLLIWLR